jgi:hypothetical protein
MKEIHNPEHQIDELIIKLRNLQILLEEAVLRGAHAKARDLIGQISETTNHRTHPESERRRCYCAKRVIPHH